MAIPSRSERELAGAQLREGDARYRALVEQLPDAVLVHRDRRVVFANTAARQLFRAPDPDALLGADLGQLVVPDEWSSLGEHLDPPASSAPPSWRETQMRRLDGEEAPCMTSAAAIEYGDAPAVQVVIHDITKRRRAEAAQRDLFDAVRIERDRLLALISGMQDEVWFADASGRFTLANPPALRAFALGDGEEVGIEELAATLEVLRPDGSLRAPGDAPALRALRGEFVFNEEELVRTPGTGELRCRQVSSAPVRDAAGAIIGSVSVVRDLTDRRRAEEALRETEARIHSVVHNLPRTVVYQMVAEPGSPRRFTYLSHAVTELFGCTPEQALADAGLVYGAFPPEERERLTQEEEKALATLTPFKAEIRLRTPGGEPGWIYATSAPRRRDDGSIVWDGVIVDVTDRKRAEEALIEANARLREADQQKNQFLAMLSHELRNPLAPILYSLHILDRAAPGTDQAVRAQSIIDRQIGHMTRLVDDLLDLTRLTRGKVQLHLGPLDLVQLVQRSAEDHLELFAEGGVALEVVPPSGPVWVNGDRTRLAQVIGNLLQNAAKFTPRGGGATVSIEADAARGRAVVTVRDTGKGIPAEVLPRLFSPFTQAEATHDRGKGGLGLGLSLVRWLVRLHGGEVDATSAGTGRGSTFTVRLPLVGARVPAAPAAAPADGVRPRRVLIVEDNVDSAQSLCDLLELYGHSVAVEHDGVAGIARARRFAPDVVLCDIGLPGMDGYEVARAFRADEALKGIHLVALSGYALPEDVRIAAEAGFEHHLPKPPSLEKLVAILDGLP